MFARLRASSGGGAGHFLFNVLKDLGQDRRPESEGALDEPHFACDAGLQHGPRFGLSLRRARMTSTPLIVAYAVVIDLKPRTGLMMRFSPP